MVPHRSLSQFDRILDPEAKPARTRQLDLHVLTPSPQRHPRCISSPVRRVHIVHTYRPIDQQSASSPIRLAVLGQAASMDATICSKQRRLVGGAGRFRLSVGHTEVFVGVAGGLPALAGAE